MSKNISKKLPGLTWRSLVFSALGSVVITASSMYVALRISALPWPTVFVAVLSLAVLKLLGKTDLQEINIAKTGMSAGAMIAGGVAFTLPGLWIAGIIRPYTAAEGTVKEWFMPHVFVFLAVTLAGTLFGSLLCWLMRRFYLERLNLAYPIGTAAAETLKAAESGGTSSKLMFASLGLSALFTLLRDGVVPLKIPKLIPERFLTNIGGFNIGFEFSPLGLAIGYLIGFVPTVLWFSGAIIANWLILNILVKAQVFADSAAAGQFNFTAAIGLMIGGGVGILLSFLYRMLKLWLEKSRKRTTSVNYGLTAQWPFKLILLTLAFASALTVLTSLPQTIALLIGIIFATAMSATITGQTGINPMEIFGIIVLLTMSLFFEINSYHAFLITAIVAVACGYAGDLMNDYQAGKILKTDPNAQLVSELVGGAIGAIVSVIALFAIIYQYGGVGGETGLSAAQAHTVSALLNGVGDLRVFLVALIIGCILFMCKIPSMIIGIGMLLGIPLSTAVFIGGLVNLLLSKRAKAAEKGQLVAAGMLGGEGITGTIVAIITMLNG